jgi:GGDEF domain-containing protein
MTTTAASDSYTDGAAPPVWAGPDPALLRMEALRDEIANTPIDLTDGQTLRVNFSAGIAGSPADEEATSPKALLTCADERLLAAKRAGRGQGIGSQEVPTSGPIPPRRRF